MRTKKIILKIYVKNIKKPIGIAILYNHNQIDDFFKELNDSSTRFMQFGPIGLNKLEFNYCEIIEK